MISIVYSSWPLGAVFGFCSHRRHRRRCVGIMEGGNGWFWQDRTCLHGFEYRSHGQRQI